MCSPGRLFVPPVTVSTPVPPGGENAMSTTNEMSEEQIHDALVQLAGRLTGVRQDDLRAAPAATPPTQHKPPVPPSHQDPPARVRLESLVQRAQQGDEGALPELRQALDNHPEFWQRCGDLALQAQTAWVQLISGKDILLRESLA